MYTFKSYTHSVHEKVALQMTLSNLLLKINKLFGRLNFIILGLRSKIENEVQPVTRERNAEPTLETIGFETLHTLLVTAIPIPCESDLRVAGQLPEKLVRFKFVLLVGHNSCHFEG